MTLVRRTTKRRKQKRRCRGIKCVSEVQVADSASVPPLALDREVTMTPEQMFADFYKRYDVKPGAEPSLHSANICTGTKIFIIVGKCYTNVREALVKRGSAVHRHR